MAKNNEHLLISGEIALLLLGTFIATLIINKPMPVSFLGDYNLSLLWHESAMTFEGSDVTLMDEFGETTQALIANLAEGARLLPLLKNTLPDAIIITNLAGETSELLIGEVQDAIIAVVHDRITLDLPDRGRSARPTDIVKIESK